jgi:hypothetical protein
MSAERDPIPEIRMSLETSEASPTLPGAPARRRDLLRRRRRLVNAGLALALLIGLASLRPWAVLHRQPAPDSGAALVLGPQLGYLVEASDLRHRAQLAAQGVPPYDAALRRLLDFADNALDEEPRPENPLKSNGPDGRFGTDAANAYGLGLAYAATGDHRYAEKAAEFITSWVAGAKSTRKACPDDGDCPTSLLISRHAPGFVFSASLISDSGVLDAGDLDALRAWLREVILPATSQRLNNWGDAGTFARVVMTDYLGDERGFADATRRWREMMDLVAPDGEIPEETRRGDAGMLYTQGALGYKIATAVIAERRGVDLWSYEGRRGGTLKSAVDLLARYWDRPQDWPYDDHVRPPDPSPMWELAYTHWQDPAILPIVVEERLFDDDSNSVIRWTTLTNGLPDLPIPPREN